MSKILVVTDSMISFPTPDFLAGHEVEILSVSISNGAATYTDIHGAGIDTYREFLELDGATPRIDSPSIDQFADVYEKLQI